MAINPKENLLDYLEPSLSEKIVEHIVDNPDEPNNPTSILRALGYVNPTGNIWKRLGTLADTGGLCTSEYASIKGQHGQNYSLSEEGAADYAAHLTDRIARMTEVLGKLKSQYPDVVSRTVNE
jgi:hypothetical protein